MPVAKKSYLEFYRDPRWQKKRLEVMERDGFRCKVCKSDTDTLNVHHGYYEDGKMPWEYRTESLHTLCEDCHAEEKDLLKKERKNILSLLGALGFTSSDLCDIYCQASEWMSDGKFKTPGDMMTTLHFVMRDYLKTERKHG